MANRKEKEGDRTTFLCGKAQHFLSKIPDARDVTAHSVQMDAGVSCLSARAGQRSVCGKAADLGRGGKRKEGKRNLILENNFCNFTENTLILTRCEASATSRLT